MLLWAKYKPLPQETVDRLESIALSRCGGELEGPYYSSFNSKDSDPYFDYFYGKAIDEMLADMGVNFGPRLKSDRAGLVSVDCQYDDFWMQMYNSKTSTHGLHDHWEFRDDRMCLISWVHVIKNIPDDLTSFYFSNHKNERLCPVEQDTGWMFAFPSWAAHGVQNIKVPDCNRIIMAGNIGFPTQGTSRLASNFETDLIDTAKGDVLQ